MQWRNGQTDQVDFTFDKLGRRKQLTYMPTDPHKLTITLAYDANGNMVRLCSNGGLGGKLDVYMGKTDIDLDDNVRHINRKGDSACQNVVWWDAGDSIQYDPRHQITRQDHVYYQYDASGNRKQVDDGTVLIYEMVPGSNQLAGIRHPGEPLVREFWHNRAGSRTAEGLVSYARLYFYDALGRTSGVLQQFGGGYNGSQISCTYDPLGKVRQPCEAGATTTIALGYDGPNTVRTQPDGATGAWTFVHGPGIDDPLIGMHSGGSGSEVAFYVTDGAGRQYAVANRYGYALEEDGTLAHHRYAGAISSSESFQGERQTSATVPGLSLFRNRLYDQATGRWTQEDPLGVAGGVNLYQYNGNNPASYTDPFGLCPMCIIGVAWAVYEIGSGIFDAYNAIRTVSDPSAGTGEKIGTVALAAASIGLPGGGYTAGGRLVSRIGEHAGLAREASGISGGVQRSVDALTSQLARGNLNPGIGTKHLSGDIFYARSRDGARVFFRQSGDDIEILAKATKQSESRVINLLREIYK